MRAIQCFFLFVFVISLSCLLPACGGDGDDSEGGEESSGEVSTENGETITETSGETGTETNTETGTEIGTETGTEIGDETGNETGDESVEGSCETDADCPIQGMCDGNIAHAPSQGNCDEEAGICGVAPGSPGVDCSEAGQICEEGLCVDCVEDEETTCPGETGTETGDESVDECPPLIICDIDCEFGMKQDENGCDICECECPILPCAMDCEFGLKQDEYGCDMCECEDPPNTETGEETGSESGNEENHTWPDATDSCIGEEDTAILASGAVDEELNTCTLDCFDPSINMTECVGTCLNTATGLSEDCGGCFGALMACSLAECATSCLGAEDVCIQCMVDAGCVAHFVDCSGLPEDYVIGEEEPVEDGVCVNAQDMAALTTLDAATDICDEACPATAPDPFGSCYEDCLEEQTALSTECAGCFGAFYGCMLQYGCLSLCQEDGNEACTPCLEESGCMDALAQCSGIPANTDEPPPPIPDGACTPQSDFFESGEFYNNFLPCMSQCSMTNTPYPVCITDCASQAGANWECAQCFGVMATCSEEKCDMCLNPTGLDPAECMVCLEAEGCNAEFTECSGLQPMTMMGAP